jgi:hypothetical protein
MRYSQNRGDWMFTVIPVILVVGMAVVFTFVIAQFALVGYLAYTTISDPSAVATGAGSLVGEFFRSAIEASK